VRSASFQPEGAPPPTLRVVVADPDPVSRRVLTDTLQPPAYQVAEAVDAAEAWTLLERSAIDVLIVDWGLPDAGGPALVRRLRSTVVEGYVYVIALSALRSQSAYRTVVEDAADDLLLKPFDTRELLARLHVAGRIAALISQVQRLERLLPVCAYCHRIRDDAGGWHRLETYLEDRAGVQVSHGLCPTCFETVRRVQLGEP